MFSNLSIKNKNRLLVGLVGVIILVMGYLALSLTISSVYHERHETAKSMTELAHDVLKKNYADFEVGLFTEDEALKAAIGTLRPMRYGDSGYFYLYKRDGTILMLPPKPELEGETK